MHQHNQKKSQVVAIDLFCGAGGLTRGLLDAGIQVKLGIDFDDSFRKTYQENNRPAIFRRENVKYLSGLDLERDLDLHPDQFFLLAACAPCQPFSRHIKNHRYDRRKSLFLQIGRILKEFRRKPDFLFFENVPAITSIDNGRIYKEFCAILTGLNYNFEPDVVDTKNYGIPQSRKRFVMLGIKRDLFDSKIVFPPKTHGKGLLPYNTVRNTIEHLPPIEVGQQHELVLNHASANLNEINRRRIRLTPRDGGSRDAWPEDLVLKCHKNHTGHKDVYGRMKWDAPSPTLTCKCTSISNGRFGHPVQDRAISLREAALLQTFGPDYAFYGLFQNMAKQIGNAVPVLLAKVFAEYLTNLPFENQLPLVKKRENR